MIRAKLKYVANVMSPDHISLVDALRTAVPRFLEEPVEVRETLRPPVSGQETLPSQGAALTRLIPIRFQKSDFGLKWTPALTWFPGQWRPKIHYFKGSGCHGPASQVRDSSYQFSTLDRELVSAGNSGQTAASGVL
jgi:hypothetical protein